MSYDSGVARQVITAALPERLTEDQRQALAVRIEDRIKRWLEIKPEIEPHRDDMRELANLADKVEGALEEAGGTLLREFDVEQQIESIKSRNATLGIEPDPAGGQPLAGRSASVDLYLIAWRAIDELRKWNRLYRPNPGRPSSFTVQLVESLKEEYELGCATLESGSREPVPIGVLEIIIKKSRDRYAVEFKTLLAAVEKLPGIPVSLSTCLPAVRARTRVKNSSR